VSLKCNKCALVAIPPSGCLPALGPQFRLLDTRMIAVSDRDNIQTHPPAFSGNSTACFVLWASACVCTLLRLSVLCADLWQCPDNCSKRSRETIFLIPLLVPSWLLQLQKFCTYFFLPVRPSGSAHERRNVLLSGGCNSYTCSLTLWLHCNSARKKSIRVPEEFEVMPLLLFSFSLITFWFATITPKWLNFCLHFGDETSTYT
jgi:hypothetical protein